MRMILQALLNLPNPNPIMKGGIWVNLPIDQEILKKRSMIPNKIAELSYFNQEAAIKYLRIWGERKMPVTELFQELTEVISDITNG
jgi:hypothetical protein